MSRPSGTAELLSRLQELNVRLTVEDGRLRCNAPKGVLTPDLTAELKARKTEILERLEINRHLFSLPPIDRVRRDGYLPPSPAQQRLWLIEQVSPGSAANILSLILRFRGSLDSAALEKSLREVLRRQETLRTTLVNLDGVPKLLARETVDWNCDAISLEGLPEGEREAALKAIASERLRRPFDLSSDPLLRACLVALGGQDHVLLIEVHRLAADDASAGILSEEIIRLYEACSKGDPSPLTELPIQYVDYVNWHRDFIERGPMQTQLRYWKEKLNGTIPTLDLPSDRIRPPVKTFKGSRIRQTFSPALTESLRRFSDTEGVTLFVTLLAAFKILLSRYTGLTDLIVGSTAAGRGRSELESLVGLFANHLVLRTDLSGNPAARALLARVRDTVSGAFANDNVPLGYLAEILTADRDLGRTPFFQVMFVRRECPLGAVESDGFTVNRLDLQLDACLHDLTVVFSDRTGSLSLDWEFSADLFNASTIERMQSHYLALLQGMLEDPAVTIEQLPILTGFERLQQIVEWNRTGVEYPLSLCLFEFIEAQVERTPDTPAVVFEDQTLSYRQLNSRSNQLAHYLRKQGVGPETLVAVCAKRSIDMVVALLGIIKAGGAYVPLDPDYPAERLSLLLEDVRAPLVLTQQEFLPRIPGSQKSLALDTDWSEVALEPDTNPAAMTNPMNAVYVIYTSGSTGRPKGVINIHKGIVNRLLWMQDAYKLGSDDRVLQKTPYTFDVSVWEFFWPLITGACLVIAVPDGHRDPSYLVTVIAKQRITTLHFVPSMLDAFLEAPGIETLDSLRRVICSGEALSFKTQKRFFERCGAAELHNLYGPTEASVDVTFWECRRDSTLPFVPIGKPIANTQIYVVDSRMNAVPIGVPGELYIGGVGVARGYLNRAELTAERFVSDPFSTASSARLYRTGDLVRFLPDGTIEYLGRMDNQVKIRGFRIELGEIESVLRQHPMVRAAAVTAREDSPGTKRLVAYVVCTDLAPDVRLLREHLKKTLPEYMVPAAFVLLQKLPTTTNGKIDHKALPVPDDSSPVSSLHAPPRTKAEEEVVAIWQDLLQKQRVGVDDNFFDLGGNSLLVVQLQYKLRQRFNREISLVELFQRPTVGSLAGLLAE